MQKLFSSKKKSNKNSYYVQAKLMERAEKRRYIESELDRVRKYNQVFFDCFYNQAKTIDFPKDSWKKKMINKIFGV